MSTTPPDEPAGTPGSTPPPPSGPDYGAPPPSGPDYGAPPPSGPDYGAPPPPPQPGGYGTPPGDGGYGGAAGGSDWSIGDALSYGFEKFTANLGQILLAALLLLLATVIALAISIPVRLAIDNGNGNFFVSELSGAVVQIILSIFTWVIQAAIVRGALDITEGRRFQVTGLFSRLNIGNVILASLLVSVITFIGTLLCLLPGIIAWFLLLFVPFFVVGEDMPAVQAIRASIDFTMKNLANMILWFIVGGIVYLVGYCILCIGILVTAPVVIIGAAFTYKKLSGQPVAP